MKKALLFLLSLTLIFSLASCFALDVDVPGKETYASEESEEETAPKQETFGLNETAVFKNLKISALQMEQSQGKDYFVPQDGNVFIGVKFEIVNTSDEDQSVSSLLMFDAYADDVKCDYSVAAACAFNDGTLDGTIAPGKKLVGWYAIEAPSHWAKIELSVKADLLSNAKASFEFVKP